MNLAEVLDRAQAATAAGVPIYQTRVGTMICTYFTDRPVVDWTTAAQANTQDFATFFQMMLKNGVYLPPAQFEAYFLSTEHGDKELDITAQAAEKAMAAVKQSKKDN